MRKCTLVYIPLLYYYTHKYIQKHKHAKHVRFIYYENNCRFLNREILLLLFLFTVGNRHFISPKNYVHLMRSFISIKTYKRKKQKFFSKKIF